MHLHLTAQQETASPNTQLNTPPSYWAEHTQNEESVLDGE